MGDWWVRRLARRRSSGGRGPAPTIPNPTHDSEAGDSEVVIDVREEPGGWASGLRSDPEWAAELAERFRARAARAEAQRELIRLRERHWSGERVIEEGRTTIEWWEHPEADPYAVLGLVPGAKLDEAAAARRRIAQQCHPDRTMASGDDLDLDVRRMVAANAAFDRLRRALISI